MKQIVALNAALLATLVITAGCQQQQGQHGFDYAHVTNDTALQQRAAVPLTPPSVIYVQDFSLGSAEVSSEGSVVGGVLENRPRLIQHGAEGTTQQKLDYWSNLLADQLVKD